MRRTILALAAAALALPAVAAAKGPAQASISGPGLEKAIVLEGNGESGGNPLGDLVMQTGFFPAAFRQSPDPMSQTRPMGNLSRKYTITWVLPGPTNQTDRLRQDLYPYANGGPVTYMRPGQPFFGTERTRGGWYRAGVQLKHTLIEVGLPAKTSPGVTARLPVRAAAQASSGRDWTALVVPAAIGTALLTILAAGIVLRRRTHPAPAA